MTNCCVRQPECYLVCCHVLFLSDNLITNDMDPCYNGTASCQEYWEVLCSLTCHVCQQSALYRHIKNPFCVMMLAFTAIRSSPSFNWILTSSVVCSFIRGNRVMVFQFARLYYENHFSFYKSVYTSTVCVWDRNLNW